MGNYIQYLAITYNGKESEKGCVCVCVCVCMYICICVYICVYVYVYIYIYLNYFVVHLRLTQHCKLIILQKITQKRKNLPFLEKESRTGGKET